MVVDIVGNSGVDGTDFAAKLLVTQSHKWIAYTTSCSRLVVYRAYII